MVFFFKAIPLFIRVFLAGGQRCHSNTSIPIPLYRHQTAYDNRSNALYLFGGKRENEYSHSIYKWNINTDTWNEISTSVPTSTILGDSIDRFLSYVNAAVTINDIVYFIGMSDGYYNSGTVYRFRLSTLQWLSPASITPPPLPSIRGCLTHNTTHILMVGGHNSATNNIYSDQLQIYSISSNTWSTETINVSPINGQGWVWGYCHSIGINLYIFGGYTSESESDAIDNIFKYNPSDKWTSIGSLPQVQGYGVALYNERSRAIYLVGGYTVNTWMDAVYVFDLDTETITHMYTWTMNHARSSMPAEIINDHLYVFGGEDNDTEPNQIPLSSIEVCALPQLITMDPTTIPSVFPTTRHPSISPTTRHPSVWPTHTPSKYPSNRPSLVPVPNPSISPSQPSNRPTSSPLHPSLRADIPSLYASPTFTSAVDTTHVVSSGSVYSSASAEDMAGVSNLLLIMIGSSIVMLCLIGVTMLLIYRMIRKRPEVERVQSSAHDAKQVVPSGRGEREDPFMVHSGAIHRISNVSQHEDELIDENGDVVPGVTDIDIICNEDDATPKGQDRTACVSTTDVGALEICHNGNRDPNDVNHNGEGRVESEGCHVDLNQCRTQTGGSPNIAPDEFVVTGDDEDKNVDKNQRSENITRGFGHEDVNELMVNLKPHQQTAGFIQ